MGITVQRICIRCKTLLRAHLEVAGIHKFFDGNLNCIGIAKIVIPIGIGQTLRIDEGCNFVVLRLSPLDEQVIKLQQGISKEKGKEVVKIIKGMKVKVQAQIMDDQVRVTGKKRDDLQEVMQELKGKSLDIDLQFTNMRD